MWQLHAMTIKDYLASRQMSEAKFAQLIGVTRSAVNRWLGGSRKPSLELGARIVRLTDGAVTIEDMLRD